MSKIGKFWSGLWRDNQGSYVELGSEQAAFSTWRFRAPLTFGEGAWAKMPKTGRTFDEGSIQRETSECRRGTFYFNINLNIYQLRFLSKHGAAKVRDLEVVVQTPFRSLCAITHHNLSLRPSTLMAASSCYSASSASYIHLNGPKKWTNESTSESAMSDASKHVNHITFTFSAMSPLFAPNTLKMTSNVT